MTTTSSTIIDLTFNYQLISAQSLLTDRTIFIDLYSQQALWLICLNKSSLNLIKKFHSLNKNFHHLYHCLIFANPEAIRKKLGVNCDKGELYWVDKRHREAIYESLKIIQLPWILTFEQGGQIYSAHDFPSDFSNLHSYKDPDEEIDSPSGLDSKKILVYKEQLQVLKKRVKKYERKEIEYKAQITELKDNLKSSGNEVQDLKRKVKDYETKVSITPDADYKKYLLNMKESVQKNIFSLNRPQVNDDIWKVDEDGRNEMKDLDDLTGSRELWINNLENKIKAGGYKGPMKLFPIEKVTKFNSAREFSSKRKTPEPPKISSRKYVY